MIRSAQNPDEARHLLHQMQLALEFGGGALLSQHAFGGLDDDGNHAFWLATLA
jgi:hypothetical protein